MRQRETPDKPYISAMLIYNVTSKVDHTVHAAWLKWMETAFLPSMMATNTVTSYHLTRLLGIDESGGPTYALLLSFSNRAAFKAYEKDHAPENEKAVRKKWGDGVLSFASKLDVVLKG